MVTCEWFAKCDNETDAGAAHPILGVVPICRTCAAKLGVEITHTLTP